MLQSLDENAHQFVRFMGWSRRAAGFFSPYVHQAEALESWSEEIRSCSQYRYWLGKTRMFSFGRLLDIYIVLQGATLQKERLEAIIKSVNP